MLRIAVDARPLAHPHTGIGRYTEALLRRLVESGDQWFLYSDRAITPRFPIDDHVQVRCGATRPGSPLSLFYSQLVFPRWARGDCVDLFWSPRHHLPLWLPASVKGVVTVHDLVWKRFPETMMGKNLLLEKLLMGPSLERADKIIAVSDFTRSELFKEYPGCAPRCQTITEAADRPVQHYEEKFPCPDAPYLLFVGTPEPRKNLTRLLAAYARARAGGIAEELVLVGAGGWGEQNIKALVQKHKLEQCVHIRARVSDAELSQLYSGATSLLMPSLYEGFGLPALEAMCHAVPVIASNLSALPEVVAEGGLLVDPNSEESMASAIIQMCQNPELRQSLSQQAQQQAAKFSWERSAEQTLAVLREIHNDSNV